jgi:hypothetical protein
LDNIKIVLGKIGWGGVDWITLVQDKKKWRAVLNAAMIELSLMRIWLGCVSGL